MRIVAIGDIHAHTSWKKIIEKELPKADKIIFIGDYFDTFQDVKPVEQVQIFSEIIELKKANPDKIVVLLGNHDYHYLKHIKVGYSGYSSTTKSLVQDLLTECVDKNEIQLCFKHDKFLFTHAGVSQTWVKNITREGILTEFHFEPENIEQTLNDILKTSPKLLNFTIGRNLSSSGEDITQTPIWIRPYSLKKDMIPYFTQIVGHTPQEKLVPSMDVTVIDTMHLGQYLIIQDNIMEVGLVE